MRRTGLPFQQMYIHRTQETGLHAAKLLAEKFGNSAHTVVLLNYFPTIISSSKHGTEIQKKIFNFFTFSLPQNSNSTLLTFFLLRNGSPIYHCIKARRSPK